MGAVELVPQRAYADFIAGSTLVEIKTGYVDVDDIEQALTYALLDISDRWRLTRSFPICGSRRR